jgi:hypothetical protein
MAKIRNRFKKDNVITVHDELLSTLYGLDPANICCKEINGEKYLVNSVKCKNFEIGLRLKLSDCDKDLIIVEFETPYEKNTETFIRKKIERNYQKLCFTNLEKYVLNILFDKFLSNYQEFDMTFLEMERYYRGKAKQRTRTLSINVAKKYATALDELSKKELFLITSNSFRAKKYGVNSQQIYQPLLVINSSNLISPNNVIFSYSLGGFGNVIKLSRRYSTILPICAYRIGFNQLRNHMTAFYLAQEVFIQSGIINKDPENEKNWSFDVVPEEYILCTNEVSLNEKKITNPLRLKRKIANYILTILPLIDGVSEVKNEYVFDETERFMLKHEFDYDIENDLDNYEFNLNDLDQDTDIKITAWMYQY